MKIAEALKMLVPKWFRAPVPAAPADVSKLSTKAIRARVREAVAEGEKHASDISAICRKAREEKPEDHPVGNGC